MDEMTTRSGFIALAGRPNVGKSTLINALVGRKVAIVSDKPQTTRRAVRGVVTHPDEWQMVLTDLPGVQRPRDRLTERMQRTVESELGDADGVLFVVDGLAGVGGAGDRWIASLLSRASVPVVIAVNKMDKLSHAQTVEALSAAGDLGIEGAEIYPISAVSGKGVPALVEELVGLLGPGPFYFPADEVSDQSSAILIAELVREQVLHRTRQEVPHSAEVIVEEIEDEDDDLVTVRAVVLVETESQKGILIGKAGAMIKAIGTGARHEVERELGRRVHLDLRVRVRRHWRTDENVLDRLGIT
jgi:GTP-binding protein Era